MLYGVWYLLLRDVGRFHLLHSSYMLTMQQAGTVRIHQFLSGNFSIQLASSLQRY